MKFKEFLNEPEMINESINDAGILHACMMSGQPGSGKSYVISRVSAGNISPRIVNSDKATEFLKHKTGIKTWGENWSIFSGKVKSMSKKQLSLYLNSLLPLWIDGTSSSPSSVFKREGILKSIGYDTSMIWITTSLDTAIERNRQRERTVDEDFLIETYHKIEKLKSYYKGNFKLFKEINNDEGELTEDIIIDAYKKMSSYFLSPIENPVGIELINNMKQNGHKYLVDTEKYDLTYLTKLVDNWYVY